MRGLQSGERSNFRVVSDGLPKPLHPLIRDEV
jgi:hypothetical protein